MKISCLIPVTRDGDLLERARESARRAGYAIQEWRDADRRGQSYARNQLIAAAIADGATHALFLDDDDEILLPAAAVEAAITPDVDIVYFNWERRTHGDITIRFPADARRVPQFGAAPWIFCARLAALELIRAVHGDVFPENQRYRVGETLWRRMIDARLQFRHVPRTLIRHYHETDAAQLTRQAEYLER